MWGWRRHAVTRVRPTLVLDGHGNHVADWSSPDEAPIGEFLVAPSTAASEELGSREHATRDAWTLYGPAAADVTAGDAVRFTGSMYRLVGVPQRWEPGTVLEVERWDG